MKRYQAYLFDLYGTLVEIHTVESKASLWRCMAAYYTHLGAAYSPAQLRQSYLSLTAGLEASMAAVAPRDARVEISLPVVFQQLYTARGIRVGEDVIQQTAETFRAASTTRLRVYAGARRLLADLHSRGSKVILLSNAQSCFTMPELRRLSLDECFDRIYISSDSGRKKPDPAFFLLPMKEFGLSPRDCLMIGNDLDCDIRGADAAGMDAFYLHTALSPQPAPEFDKLPAVGWLPRMNLNALRRLL